MRLAERLQQDQHKLVQALGLSATDARFEVQLLAARALGVTRAWLIAHGDERISTVALAAYPAWLDRRLAGEPVAYVFGEREFYGHLLKVSADVLIPRPDTELPVELALARIAPDHAASILDLGTGSGAIAIAVALARPKARVLAVDKSAAALHLAAENAARLGAGNLEFQASDWWQQLPPQRFDLILSNPPYVAAGDPHLAQGDLRFEPVTALASGADGLDDLRHIITDAPHWLKPGGWLMLEHGYDQGAAVRDLLKQVGLDQASTHCDLAGRERVTLCGME